MEDRIYLPRLIDKEIIKRLKVFGAVCVEGPKWCGKTWTSIHHSKSEYFIGDPANDFQNKKLAELDPNLILEGSSPRLLDEWQEVPKIWDAVRYEVDRRGEKGQFILTGSSTPMQKGVLHSGAGRISTIRMRPMSLFESGESTGQISLEDICNGEFKSVLTGEVKLSDLIYYIIRGGWPGSLDLDREDAYIVAREYLKQIVDHDIYRLEGINRDSRKMEMLLRSLARHESTTASNRTLKRDIREYEDDVLDDNTISTYLALFERLFLLDNQEAYSTNLRSSVRLKQKEKRHFVDPSLAAGLLGATYERLMEDLQTLGFLFESLCERDLRIYAETFGGKTYHYQDYDGFEIDTVIELENGDWCAFEIKLGANQIDEASENLCNIKNRLEKEGAKAPKVLCVVCGMTNAAYLREDGVYVVPITGLKN